MGKGKQFKITWATLVLLVGTIFNVYFSTIIHQILSNNLNNLKVLQLKECLYSLKLNPNHFKLFLAFEVLVILGSIFFYTTNDKPYQSDLINITPTISTPVSAGQKQFGSARWMQDKEKDQSFETCIIKENDELIRYLMSVGSKDIEEDLNEVEAGEENQKDGGTS